jgi:DegV family protein with EDD domain
MPVKIITDSSCDLAPGLKEALNIDVIPLYINIGEQSFLDGVTITREEFYQNLTSYTSYPKTAAPSPATFMEHYQKAADEGYTEVVSIHVSGKLSATIESARMGANEFNKIPVHVIDSQNLSAGAGFVVQHAAQAAKDGKNIDEVLALIEEILPKVYTFAVIANLDHLKHSGRMANIITTLSSLLNIRIMLKMGHGRPGAEQFRTFKKSVNRIVELADHLRPFTDFHFVHTNTIETANVLIRKISPNLNEGIQPKVLTVNPVLGAHIGPTAFGFSCVTVNPPELSIFEKSIASIRHAVSDIKLPKPSTSIRSLLGDKDESEKPEE